MNNWKKAHRKMTKEIKRLNTALADDGMWRGRFSAHETALFIDFYDDGSGFVLTLRVLLSDSVSKKTKYIYVDNYDYSPLLWYEMNDFIVKDVKVWEE